MASKPVIFSRLPTYRYPQTSTNSPTSYQLRTKINHQLIYLPPKQISKPDKIDDSTTFTIIANKQSLFKEIRDVSIRNDISDDLKQELDTYDLKYIRENHRNLKSVNEAIKKAAHSLNVSPVTKFRKKTTDEYTINNCNTCLNDTSPQAIRLKAEIFKGLPEIKTLTPKAVLRRSTLNTMSQGTKGNDGEEYTHLLKIRPQRKRISQAMHRTMESDINGDIEASAKQAQYDRWRSKKEPTENNNQLPKLRLPLSLNTSMEESIDPTVKFELLYSYFKSPATRKH